MPSAEDPARSRAEQPDAERAYHEALAALDDALRQLAATPYAGNFRAPEPEGPRGWGQRLSAFAWRRVPLLRQQRDFNAALVETLTRFVSQLTPYVDTRNRELSAALSKLAEGAAAARDAMAGDFSAGLGKLAQDASAARSQLAEDAAAARDAMAGEFSADLGKLAQDASAARSQLAEDAAAARDAMAGEFSADLGKLAQDASAARGKLAQDLAENFSAGLDKLAQDASAARGKLAQDLAENFSAGLDKLAQDASAARGKLAQDLAENFSAGLDKLAQDASAALVGVADDMLKHWESMAAREQRQQARVDEIRQAATAWRQVTGALRQELDRLRAQPAPDAPPLPAAGRTGQPDPRTQLATPQESYKYVGFEDRFRGAAVDIRAGLADYARQFDGASDVLDAGCGRGEFLEILRERGVTASGVDLNPEMVAQCHARELQVAEGDLLAHLAALPDASLGGLFAAQVVEHLEPAYLLKFIDTAFLKLRPGARIVLETINVASWTAFFQSYVRDITHVRPLHPDTLAYLVTAGGFQQVEIVYRSPIPPEHQLARAPERAGGEETLDRMTAVFNRNVDELNRLLFGDQDYAVIAERG